MSIVNPSNQRLADLRADMFGGDAAFCASPTSGQGTSLAVVGAYVLAAELAGADGDHPRAFAEYERRMRGWVEATQKMGRDNAKRFSARNRFEVWLQPRLLRIMPYLPGKSLFMRQLLDVVNGIEPPDTVPSSARP
jgi:2-polyprenyl-6-methoxyphenol hydroxylase-like FAD-dependent oxidoreductase